MRENRTYGSEGGEGRNPSRPLSACGGAYGGSVSPGSEDGRKHHMPSTTMPNIESQADSRGRCREHPRLPARWSAGTSPAMAVGGLWVVSRKPDAREAAMATTSVEKLTRLSKLDLQEL